MNNWKSLVAFILFISTYMYMVVIGADVDKVEVTGTLALIAMGFIMVRSEGLQELIKAFIERSKR